MPTLAVHRARAEANERIANRLDPGLNPDLDWRVTMLFYAAVHWVEAYLDTRSVHSRSHADRVRALQALQFPLLLQYQALEDASRRARYDCSSYTLEDVRLLETTSYQPVRQHILTLLPQP